MRPSDGYQYYVNGEWIEMPSMRCDICKAERPISSVYIVSVVAYFEDDPFPAYVTLCVDCMESSRERLSSVLKKAILERATELIERFLGGDDGRDD